ncbi:MAG: hypothetical protein MUP09_04880 [Thiovulaceae bacterium]|nr:hypothetical protein [Sulfurimonadaceae bacterium]
MKSNQYSVKVYETTITDENKFISFFDTNYLLFRDYLIVIRGEISERIEAYLNNKSLKFLVDVELPRGRVRKAGEKAVEEQKKQNLTNQKIAEEKLSELSDKLQNNLKVLDTIVRSGVELKIEGDLLLLNRVNSGAAIRCSGNLIITQIVEGSIYCDGNFMMLSASSKAKIIFKGVDVDSALLENRLNRVELIDNEISIKPILKETRWAS